MQRNSALHDERVRRDTSRPGAFAPPRAHVGNSAVKPAVGHGSSWQRDGIPDVSAQRRPDKRELEETRAGALVRWRRYRVPVDSLHSSVGPLESILRGRAHAERPTRANKRPRHLTGRSAPDEQNGVVRLEVANELRCKRRVVPRRQRARDPPGRLDAARSQPGQRERTGCDQCTRCCGAS